MLKKLAGCIREFKKPAVITLILILFEAVIETVIPFITADLVNRIKDGAEMNEILKSGFLLIALALISLACGGIAAVTCAKASAGFAKNLRHDVFANIQGFTFENIDKFSSSSLVTRLTTDITNVQMSFMMIIRTAVRSPLLLIFSTVMAYVMGGSLATTFVVVIPFLGIGLYLVGQKAMPAFRSVFKKYDDLNESIEENVRAMRVVKGFSREQYEKDKFDKAAENIRGYFTKAERIVAFNTPLMQICMYFNMVFILLVGSKMAITSNGADIDVGQISAMLTYGVQVLMSLMMLSMIYVMITMSAESAKRICEVLDEKPSMKDAEKPVTTVADGSVSFENVNFKYSSKAKRFALSDIDLNIRSGMTVGIIGGTGSSKSSLVQLIPRLYDTTEGSVKVGGIDVRDYDLTALRDSVAMVLQKNLLFSGTIKDNLRWGNEDASEEDLWKAIELAQATDVVNGKEDGLQHMVEQGGRNLSGGQRQRLTIARALVKNPEILILDDSASALDFATDAKLRAALATIAENRTIFIVSQRTSSIAHADQIIVLEDGEAVGIGTHEELLEQCEVYREIYDSQFKQEERGHENE